MCPETPTEHLSRDPGPHQLPRWVWSSGEGLSWSSGRDSPAQRRCSSRGEETPPPPPQAERRDSRGAKREEPEGGA